MTFRGHFQLNRWKQMGHTSSIWTRPVHLAQLNSSKSQLVDLGVVLFSSVLLLLVIYIFLIFLGLRALTRAANQLHMLALNHLFEAGELLAFHI